MKTLNIGGKSRLTQCPGGKMLILNNYFWPKTFNMQIKVGPKEITQALDHQGNHLGFVDSPISK